MTRIGMRCHFVHPETKQLIEGTYQRGRKVVVMTGMKVVGPGQYDVSEVVYTVPGYVRITFGPVPLKEEE